MTLQIPNDVVQALRVPEDRAHDELRKELAISLVREGLLSVPMGRRLADMDRVAFEDLLFKRRISITGTAEEILGDLAGLPATDQSPLQPSPTADSACR